jgi:hypothetical protein
MKQSVYLSDTEHARWKALGVTLGDVVRAGLATLEEESWPAAKDLTAVAHQQDQPSITGAGILSATAEIKELSDENR